MLTAKTLIRQADLSLRWVHRSFCWFCHALVHLINSLSFNHGILFFLQMASTYMKSDDVSTLYISQARQLEDQGKFKEAEKYVN